MASQPAVTRDGHHVEVAANVGNLEDLRRAVEHGAEGIGLLRTDFLFLDRSQPPDEETQLGAYRAILERMQALDRWWRGRWISAGIRKSLITISARKRTLSWGIGPFGFP